MFVDMGFHVLQCVSACVCVDMGVHVSQCVCTCVCACECPRVWIWELMDHSVCSQRITLGIATHFFTSEIGSLMSKPGSLAYELLKYPASPHPVGTSGLLMLALLNPAFLSVLWASELGSTYLHSMCFYLLSRFPSPYDYYHYEKLAIHKRIWAPNGFVMFSQQKTPHWIYVGI